MAAHATEAVPRRARGLLTDLRRLARDPESGFTAAGGAAEAAVLDPGDGVLAESGAEVVEGETGRLCARPVGAPAESGFTSFLDGIQRSAVALYHGPVPLVYAYAAAVIRSRRSRRLGTLRTGPAPAGRGGGATGASGAEPSGADGWAGAAVGGASLRTRYQEEREAVFIPFPLVPPQSLAAAGISPGRCRDTAEGVTEPLPLFPPALYARAATAVNGWRESLERELAERWCTRGDDPGWLLVDGSLTLSPGLAAARRVVGVIKSHRTRFFDGDDARVLLGLRAGERTSVFRPGTRGFTPVHSWYLRLRAPEGRGIFWGLVRVEVAATAASITLADEISRWLLAETAPLSLPDARWDRLLYPIHDCEAYLRARAPRVE